MEVSELLSELSVGRSLVDLLRLVGTECLDIRDAIKRDKYYSAQSDAYLDVRSAITRESELMWQKDGSFRAPLGADASATLRQLSVLPGLATLAVLEGVCRGAGWNHFLWLSKPIEIERGMVLPLPRRRLRRWAATPNPATTHNELLDPASGFVIWDRDWTVELDFTFRERLEDLCWRAEGVDERGEPLHVLPRIASIHPFSGADMASPDEMADQRFFGVHPKVNKSRTKESNAQVVFDALGVIGVRAEVAVVPEFTLHESAALESLWTDDGTLPPIIVAGSAHCDGDQRSNTSIAYVDGVRMLEVAKYQPFVYREPSGRQAAEESVSDHRVFTEAISPQPRVVRVAASTSTRLAVAICSDLNSLELVATLNDAGTNLLLCPAWTPKEGAFPGALQTLASYSQCVSLVANTPGHPAIAGEPFWALTMVPRDGARAESQRPVDSAAVAGVLDPNRLPEDEKHFTWVGANN